MAVDWYRIEPDHTVRPASPDEAMQPLKERRVEYTVLRNGVAVSTVFLALDHATWPGSKPLLFESLVFGGRDDGEMRRCSTWEEANRQHWAMVHTVEIRQRHWLVRWWYRRRRRHAGYGMKP